MAGNGKRLQQIYYKESHLIEHSLITLEKNIEKTM